MEKKINKERFGKEVYSKTVRAGRRTYFFDIRSTENNSFYLSITESLKKTDKEEGKTYYEKQKIILYQEDFDKFVNAFNAVLDFTDSLEQNCEKAVSEIISENLPDIYPDDQQESSFEDENNKN